jgi:hypothetical protein
MLESYTQLLKDLKHQCMQTFAVYTEETKCSSI